MVTEGDLGERVRRASGGSAIALQLDPQNYADNYVLALNAVLRDVGLEGDTHTIYVSVTNPSALVWTLAQAFGVTADRLSFVDAISHIMMDFRSPLANASYIESPRMLENIMLRVEYLLRKHPTTRNVVVIDSVNSLGIHNPPTLLSEFLHILISNLKARQVLTILLATSDESATFVDQILALVVDETVAVRAEAPAA
jgi:KaiC/GvpD/RAD55 family RecA-like ATPase